MRGSRLIASQRARSGRLRREARTVELMIRMSCRYAHGEAAAPPGTAPSSGAGAATHAAALCPDCATLLDYALGRVDACIFGA